jgi:para-aminobenzoate synthetase component 1
MNTWAAAGIPFIFLLDFELQKPVVIRCDQVPDDIFYKFNHVKNYELKPGTHPPLEFREYPMHFHEYKSSFDQVQSEIMAGNSFLLNLTFPTPITTNYSLMDLFKVSLARYKLYYRDEFIVFSPETFVRIREGRISTYPMKGTIDAQIPGARDIILNDNKETAEHHTIVDLLRNDLSQVAKKVQVKKFRYIDEIQTSSKHLLQVSSEIEGILPADYLSSLGDIFARLLPAGSISGAPKKKTLEIIRENEIGLRGYYTGVMGLFDGTNVDSAVMIRYIEKNQGELLYRSGCGITFLSDAAAEYQEMIDKVYVPVDRKY